MNSTFCSKQYKFCIFVKLRPRLFLRLSQALTLCSDSDPETGLTLKSCEPPPPTHPTTFKPKGGVPYKNPKRKTD